MHCVSFDVPIKKTPTNLEFKFILMIICFPQIGPDDILSFLFSIYQIRPFQWRKFWMILLIYHFTPISIKRAFSFSWSRQTWVQVWLKETVWKIFSVREFISWSILIFTSFCFWFWKRKYFLLPSPFSSIQVRGTLLLFLLFLFGLQAWSSLYPT